MTGARDLSAFKILSPLEPSVCDAKNMVSLATACFEEMTTGSRPDKAGFVTLCDWQIELAMFALYQARHMMDELRDEYYAALDGQQK